MSHQNDGLHAPLLQNKYLINTYKYSKRITPLLTLLDLPPFNLALMAFI